MIGGKIEGDPLQVMPGKPQARPSVLILLALVLAAPAAVALISIGYHLAGKACR